MTSSKCMRSYQNHSTLSAPRYRLRLMISTDTAPAKGFQTSSLPYCSPVCVLPPLSALALSLNEWGLEDLLPLLYRRAWRSAFYLKSICLECAARCNTCNLNEQLSQLKPEHPCFLVRHLPLLQRTVQLKTSTFKAQLLHLLLCLDKHVD